jgi:CDP-4-dehydro-6-deoxyglucose reductase
VNYRVTWIEAGESFDASPDETVLDAAARAGVRLPSECTFGGCGTCRVKLVGGHVHYDEPPLALSPDEAAEGYALMCQARAAADLRISTDRPLPSPVAPARRRASVVAAEPLCGDVHRLVLSLHGDEPFAFRPGQYLNVLLGDAGARSFSMASLPDANTVELHIRRIEGGYFTGARLGALRAGDALELELPLGGFGYHEEDYRPIVMAATGTGIAPLKSMLAALLPSADRPPIALYWGGRTRDDLYLHDELAAWSAQYDDFSYTPVLSRAGD